MTLLGIANPKQKAIEIVQTVGAPTGFFEPGSLFFWLTIIFFLLSAVMVWLIIRAGKGKNYGE